MTAEQPPRRPGEHGPTRPPSERSDTIRISPRDHADLLEVAVSRVVAEIDKRDRDRINRQVQAEVDRRLGEAERESMSAELTHTRSRGRSLERQRRAMIYAIVTLAAGLAGGIFRELLPSREPEPHAQPAEVDPEQQRRDRLDSRIRELEAERDTMAR